MTTAAQLVPVTTRIESDLHRLLDEKSKAADRSLAAEIRQAIRAWVEVEETEDHSDSKAQVGA
jgi:predicted transcriptional regulator